MKAKLSAKSLNTMLMEKLILFLNVSYNFFEASIIMNVIVGVIVDAVNDSRKEIDEESNKSEVTLESIAKQLEELNRKFDR